MSLERLQNSAFDFMFLFPQKLLRRRLQQILILHDFDLSHSSHSQWNSLGCLHTLANWVQGHYLEGKWWLLQYLGEKDISFSISIFKRKTILDFPLSKESCFDVIILLLFQMEKWKVQPSDLRYSYVNNVGLQWAIQCRNCYGSQVATSQHCVS